MSWIEDPGVEIFEGLNLYELSVDQCYLNVTTNLTSLWLYSLYDDCYNCPYKREANLIEWKGHQKYKTRPGKKWRIRSRGVEKISPIDDSNYLICDVNPSVGEFGVYNLEVDDNNICHLKTLKEPVNIYLPILIPFFIFLGLSILYPIVSKLWQKWHSSDEILTNVNENVSKEKQNSKRIRAIDTFRGFCIAGMIFVNTGAGGYDILEHAVWNGLQFSDIFFPWFMWIMGICIPISVGSQLRKNVSKIDLIVNTIRRSAILFGLGLMLNTIGVGSNLETIRIFGVLQRFAVCYLVTAFIVIVFTKREDTKENIHAWSDITRILPQWIAILLIVLAHTLITLLLNVPDCPRGYMGPGGIQDDGIYEKCIGGATRYVDALILGESHMYKWLATGHIYDSTIFDPENILGCLTSIFQVFLGVQAGTTLQLYKAERGHLWRWLSWGTATSVCGGILCLFSRENGWVPINKNLWSLSYVLVTSGMAFIVLCFLYQLIDCWKLWSGKPFLFAGMNSTIMYVGHQLGYNLFPFRWQIGLMNTHFILLIESLWATCSWVIVAFWLYTNKFFLSI